MKITKISLTALSILLSCIAILIMAVCLQIGGLAAIIALSMWLLLVMIVLIGVVRILINPKNKSMDIGIARDENGKGHPNAAAWDEYIIDYDNRGKNPSLWISLLIQMALLATFINYGHLYAAVIFVVSMVLCEAARYRMYRCIKKNKLGWAAASFVVEVRDFLKDIVENRKTKSINREE